MMLAGAQLGITLCTLGLGALAKPAVSHLLEPAFEALGLPEQCRVRGRVRARRRRGQLPARRGRRDGAEVVGDQPPGVLGAAAGAAVPGVHPVTRPALVALNGLANACLRAGQGASRRTSWRRRTAPTELRLLVQSSREHGTLGAAEHDLLTAMLAVQNTTVGQVMTPYDRVVTVAADAPAREVERISRRAGRSRLAVVGSDGGIVGIVHVRDAARATTFGRAGDRGRPDASAPLTLPATQPVAGAVRTMREHRAQLATVVDGSDDDGRRGRAGGSAGRADRRVRRRDRPDRARRGPGPPLLTGRSVAARRLKPE